MNGEPFFRATRMHDNPLRVSSDYDPADKSDVELLNCLCTAADGGRFCPKCRNQCGWGRECVKRFGDNPPKVKKRAALKEEKLRKKAVSQEALKMYSAIYKAIDEERKAQGFTSRQGFCECCGLSRGTMDKWLMGYSDPRLGTLLIVLRKLGLELVVRRADNGKA